MRFLFVTWWGGGNVTPVRVLSELLVGAGHEVRALGPARLRAECEAAGAIYVEQRGGFTAEPDELAALLAGSDAPDLVLVDFMLPLLLAEAEASGVAWAPLVHTLASSVLGDSSTTTAFVGLDAVNEHRARLGLSPAATDADLLRAAGTIVVAGPSAVDRPVSATAPVRYLGVLAEAAGPDAGWTPPGRPLVVVGLGTTPMDEVPALERVLSALDGEPLHVFATVGPHVDPTTVAAPSNATVTGYVRHAAVLPHADVVVCHAGLGTVTNALAAGVPVLCVPLGRDQHDNAARVEELGAGVEVPADAAPSEIRAAVRHLLDDPATRAAAAELAARIAEESRPERAVELVVGLAARRS